MLRGGSLHTEQSPDGGRFSRTAGVATSMNKILSNEAPKATARTPQVIQISLVIYKKYVGRNQVRFAHTFHTAHKVIP